VPNVAHKVIYYDDHILRERAMANERGRGREREGEIIGKSHRFHAVNEN